MHWAMQTAMTGEDAAAILARAQLYEEYVLEPLAPHDSAGAGLRVGFDRGEVPVHRDE